MVLKMYWKCTALVILLHFLNGYFKWKWPHGSSLIAKLHNALSNCEVKIISFCHICFTVEIKLNFLNKSWITQNYKNFLSILFIQNKFKNFSSLPACHKRQSKVKRALYVHVPSQEKVWLLFLAQPPSFKFLSFIQILSLSVCKDLAVSHRLFLHWLNKVSINKRVNDKIKKICESSGTEIFF